MKLGGTRAAAWEEPYFFVGGWRAYRAPPEPLFGATDGWQADPLWEYCCRARAARRPGCPLDHVIATAAAISSDHARGIVSRMGGDAEARLRAQPRAWPDPKGLACPAGLRHQYGMKVLFVPQ